MAGLMGFDDPLDKKLSFWGIDGRVVGVVKNFHMRDMHEAIAPLIISCIDVSREDRILIRIEGNTNTALKAIEAVTKELNMSQDFNYEFLEDSYAGSYQSEMTVSTLVRIFAGISILISCLGLFGLSAFSAEQRAKEIGIRKVHGASVKEVIMILSRDYATLMVWAFIIAIPFGYYYTSQWLESFEYRTTLEPGLFLLAGLITFLIGGFTVSFKSYFAARMNPVETLKDE